MNHLADVLAPQSAHAQTPMPSPTLLKDFPADAATAQTDFVVGVCLIF